MDTITVVMKPSVRLGLARRACALVLLAGLGGWVPAAPAGETVVGGGNNNCESYLQSDDDAKLASDSWVLGFLSSANMRSRNLDLLANLDNSTIIDALETYCEIHRDASIADAAVGLLKSLVASADGDCSNHNAVAMRKSGRLSICHTAGSPEANAEPAGFSLSLPGVE